MKKTNNKNKGTSKYTENWLPIKSISNGMIVLDNNDKVTGVKIMPRNIFILDNESQNIVLNGLKNFYNSIDYEFWIICSDRPVDVNIYLSQLQLLYNSVQSPAVRKMIREDIDKANMFTSNNVVDTEYFLFFKEKNADIIQKRIRNLINGLAGAGLVASQVSNDDIRVMLEGILNAGMRTDGEVTIV